jgi:hypothetical protein
LEPSGPVQLTVERQATDNNSTRLTGARLTFPGRRSNFQVRFHITRPAELRHRSTNYNQRLSVGKAAEA